MHIRAAPHSGSGEPVQPPHFRGRRKHDLRQTADFLM